MFHVKHWEIGAESAYFFLIEIAKKKLFLLLKYIGKRLEWIMSREQSNAQQGGGFSKRNTHQQGFSERKTEHGNRNLCTC